MMSSLGPSCGRRAFTKSFSLQLLFVYTLVKLSIQELNTRDETYQARQRWDLKIGIVHDPPRTIIKRHPFNSSVVSYSGFMKEVMDLLLKEIANRTTLIEIYVNSSHEKNGIESSVLDHITSEGVDISTRLLPISASLDKLVDTSFPILITQMCIVQPMPGPVHKYSILFYTFEPLVWLWFGIALIATTLALTILMKRKTSQTDTKIPSKKLDLRQDTEARAQKKSFVEVASYIVGSTVNRGRRLLTNRVLVRIVAGAWGLAAFVFVYSYRGIMIAKIYAPSQMALLNTFEDIASSDRRVLVGRNTPYANILLNASTGTLKAVGEILRRNPDDVILPIMNNVYSTLLTGCCTYLEDVSFANLLVYRAMKEHQDVCTLTKGKPLEAQTMLGLFMGRGSEFRSVLDKRIMRLWESGLNSEIAKRAVSERIEKCTGSSVSGRFLTTPQPLTLITLAGAFIILVAGAGLSLLVYLIEVVVSLHKAKKVKRPTVRDTGKRKTSDYSPACVAERSVKCATKGIEDLRVESASAARPEHLEGS